MTATNECALLQPITSLVASFIFVKPEYVADLNALPSTSLAENKLVQFNDPPCCSKECSNDVLSPMEADFCVNLDRLLFSTPASDHGMLLKYSNRTVVVCTWKHENTLIEQSLWYTKQNLAKSSSICYYRNNHWKIKIISGAAISSLFTLSSCWQHPQQWILCQALPVSED